VKKWIEIAFCPVLRIDGTRDYHDTAREIAGFAADLYLIGVKIICKNT
jgi:hypothetical protein